MNSRQKLLFAFLVLGLILSSMIRFTFNVSDGFAFQDFWFKILPLPVFDYAGHASNQLNLTSTVLGYLFFAVFGFLLIKEFKNDKKWISLAIGFFFLTLIAIVFEGSSIVQDLNSNFIGQHFRIGPTLFLFGLLVFTRNFMTLKAKS